MWRYDLTDQHRPDSYQKGGSRVQLPSYLLYEKPFWWYLVFVLTVTVFVSQVLAGDAPADKELGRQIMEVVQAVPNLDSDTITNMLNSHMQVCHLTLSFLYQTICCKVVFTSISESLRVDTLIYRSNTKQSIIFRICWLWNIWRILRGSSWQ